MVSLNGCVGWQTDNIMPNAKNYSWNRGDCVRKAYTIRYCVGCSRMVVSTMDKETFSAPFGLSAYCTWIILLFDRYRSYCPFITIEITWTNILFKLRRNLRIIQSIKPSSDPMSVDLPVHLSISNAFNSSNPSSVGHLGIQEPQRVGNTFGQHAFLCAAPSVRFRVFAFEWPCERVGHKQTPNEHWVAHSHRIAVQCVFAWLWVEKTREKRIKSTTTTLTLFSIEWRWCQHKINISLTAVDSQRTAYFRKQNEQFRALLKYGKRSGRSL